MTGPGGDGVGETLRFQVCGPVAVVIGGRRVEGELPGRQGRVLLAHLVVHRLRPRDRDQLVADLWPAGPPSGADQALRSLLSRLRRALGADLVAGRDAPRLVLPPEAFVDLEAAHAGLHRAEAAVATSDWARGWAPARVALHTADRGFLPGEDAPWIDDVRRDLDVLRVRALECVGAVALGLGGPELASAERSGGRLIELAPFRESGYRILMEALEASGNRAEALLVHDGLRVLLRDELGISPGPEVQAVHARLLG
jgi:DNA-binding SARP family transcriptional activator